MENNFLRNKNGQLTIFIIVAIIIIAGVAGYFIFRNYISFGGVPASIEPAYNNFLSCLEQDSETGVDLLGSRGGYIEPPKFEAGSSYMPFSSQLDFLGNPVPYWYYVSGNNVQKEQVPSVSDMESQLSGFVEEKIKTCNFKEFYNQGFEITTDVSNPQASVDIQKNQVNVNLNMRVSFVKGEDSTTITNHKVTIKTNLGKMYDNAKKVYDYEQKSLFLENYAVDNIRLYAPVDGLEITCAPKVWNAQDVFSKMEDAIVANTLALKVKGGDYTLKNSAEKYFIVDAGVSDENVNFLTSKNWPHSFEVEPSENNVLISKPVGNQPGLGIMGFCYVPYHFVYNVKYPVLVQITDGEELFQFPIAVVVQGNKPRTPLAGTASDMEPTLCEHKNNEITVSVYDTSMNPVDADISFECFGTNCNIGRTESGTLEENFPQCVNGFIKASSEGYNDARYLFSSVSSGSVDIIMDKLYEMNINLKLDGRDYNGEAILTFISDSNSFSAVYPEQKEINISEGQYKITASIYKSSSLKIAAQTTQECLDVPKTGIGGALGLTEKKCFDIEIPEQIISNVLIGGGNEDSYILESELKNSNTIEISATSLSVPTTIEELQNNYIVFETKDMEVYLR